MKKASEVFLNYIFSRRIYWEAETSMDCSTL